MLILGRKRLEEIKIICGSEVITVAVMSTDGRYFRIGVEASPQVKIHRKEVFDRINQQGA